MDWAAEMLLDLMALVREVEISLATVEAREYVSESWIQVSVLSANEVSSRCRKVSMSESGGGGHNNSEMAAQLERRTIELKSEMTVLANSLIMGLKSGSGGCGMMRSSAARNSAVAAV
jgi:hypothetical protein